MTAQESHVAPKRPTHIAIASAFSAVFVSLFGFAMAPLVAFIHAPGFLAGLVLWLTRPLTARWSRIRTPYVVAIGAYIIHRIDEGVSDFLPAMERLTGQQIAEVVSPISFLMVAMALGWMLSPLLMRKGHALGHFGAWSLFAAFGIVEPWHFLFPLLTPEPYGYFPGMITAPIMIAAGWWGMWRMWQESSQPDHPSGK